MEKKITIPLFPLNGVILFPYSNLPLNIFEKRYLEMIDFSLSSNRLIGMIQSNKNSNLYKVGCVGKITSFSETEDNRYIINLTGKYLFSIKNELKNKKNFREAEINLITNLNNKTNQINKNFNKKILLEKYKIYSKQVNLNIDFEIIEKVNEKDLLYFIAMSSSFTTEDKQMLLETLDINDFANKLISLFDFYPINEKDGKYN